MSYYHVYVKYNNEKGKTVSHILFNFAKEEIPKRFSIPYRRNQPIMFYRSIPSSWIEEFVIFRSIEPFHKLILPNGKPPTDKGVTIEYIKECFLRLLIPGVEDATSYFITSLQAQRKSKEAHRETIGKKEKVFIVHGRDEKPALQLQKYLRDKLKVDAQMFEDFKEESSGNTIIEQLEYIRDNIGYAFVIATPDDVGCLREEMEKLKNKMLLGKATIEAEKVSELLEVAKTRARQNVVFEHGLFLGALGRDRVCCLLQKDTQEKPSDIDGILYVGFDRSVGETFPEITEKLKKAGLVTK